jgi:hypothetical protein
MDYFGSADARVYAVDALMGARSGSSSLGGRIYSTIYAAEQRLHLAAEMARCTASMLAPGNQCGAPKQGMVIDSIACHHCEILLVGSEDFFVYAMNVANGEDNLEVRKPD